ncbi:MAG: type I secretion system permease/ATPase [Pantoea sp.]|uniref:ABC-type xenobiotic transporter n=1 Tax=Pantoea brenneri TaxID=472694 RepID=A0AAX3J907_9GAMM|nr:MULTISPECIES: type I secretion system permease/ATPase [Pantoea]MBS6035236.1 type I secretion system permease/ATPase [Pantoea sp.]MDH2125353.1 type I secretion system permease/ATPase [Pantoea brenneri]VXC20753.1 ATP-binding protein [Pantoea brenneri]
MIKTERNEDFSSSRQPKKTYTPWLEALLLVAKHYRLDGSPERVKGEAEWQLHQLSQEQLIENMARQLGLLVIFDDFHPDLLDPWRLPLIVDFGPRGVGVITTLGEEGKVSLMLNGEQQLQTVLTLDELAEHAQRVLLAKPETSVPDARVDDYIKPHRADWLWQTILKEWPAYVHVMFASLISNVLGLSAMLFTMQVYDRVIPSQSVPSLWVLFGGVMIALTFVFIMRIIRTHISDMAGKSADLRISDRVFGHALRIRNDLKPKSTGSFIAQIRELEQIRELITSTTISAIADLPFLIIFLFILWLLGGWLVLVPLAALPLIIIPGLLAQSSLAKLSKATMRESAVRNAMLVEAVQGMDDIKLLRAEPYFQNQWNHLNEAISKSSKKQRFISSLLMSWTSEVQTVAYIGVVLVGAFFAMSGDLSTGVLIGCSMLASRMMAPLGQLTKIFSRWQQAKVAREGLENLLKSEVDQPERSVQIHRPRIYGEYSFSEVSYRYDPNSPNPVIAVSKLTIAAGEKLALLGRNGSGKSTLLQMMAGLLQPGEGALLLDGVRLSSIDPLDVRRDVGLVSQTSSLFYGTIRENLRLGMPLATEDEMLQALEISGAIEFIRQLPEGMDYPLQEGGKGLSGGQRQQLLLARAILRQPSVLLLDEPTAWLDDGVEKHLIEKLKVWMGNRTLIIATHRPAALQLVDRILLIEKGKIVRDGSKEAMLVSRPSSAEPTPHHGRVNLNTSGAAK